MKLEKYNYVPEDEFPSIKYRINTGNLDNIKEAISKIGYSTTYVASTGNDLPLAEITKVELFCNYDKKYNETGVFVDFGGFEHLFICYLKNNQLLNEELIEGVFKNWLETAYNINPNAFECEYFTITERYIKGRKTPILEIINKNKDKIGEVRWYGPWRKFCFYPDDGTIWDNKCLRKITDFLNTYNTKWKQNPRDNKSYIPTTAKEKKHGK